jgi:hypothetical protein
MHTLRHHCRTTQFAPGLTDYMERVCNHSTIWFSAIGGEAK